ncbi:hypothetical protein OS493_039853, partial [Desmophyllum pertusum]
MIMRMPVMIVTKKFEKSDLFLETRAVMFKALSEVSRFFIRTLTTKSKEKTFFRDADEGEFLRPRT